MTTSTTSPLPELDLYRTTTHNPNLKPYTAFGPLPDGTYITWDHEEGDYAGHFHRADDAVDLMMELAYS